VQALGGGSLEFPALGPAPGDGPEDLSEPVHLPIEDALDLHSFRPADVPSVVDEYLIAAHARGFSEVRLIHGRGIGVQRAIVQSLLAKHPLVAGYADAPEARGGRGATLVRLRLG
jgi:DNA-nicking Smr family endonuclease